MTTMYSPKLRAGLFPVRSLAASPDCPASDATNRSDRFLTLKCESKNHPKTVFLRIRPPIRGICAHSPLLALIP